MSLGSVKYNLSFYIIIKIVYNLKLQVDSTSDIIIFSLCKLHTKCHEYPYRFDAHLSMDSLRRNESKISNTGSEY